MQTKNNQSLDEIQTGSEIPGIATAIITNGHVISTQAKGKVCADSCSEVTDKTIFVVGDGPGRTPM